MSARSAAGGLWNSMSVERVFEKKVWFSGRKMKRNFKIFKHILPLLAAGVLSGCMSVDYVGQTFPALPATSTIEVFSPENPMPSTGYRAIGRAEITAPPRTNGSDIRLRLIELAREKGAQAVRVAAMKKVQVGFFENDDNFNVMPNYDRDPRNAGGRFIYSNSFDNPTTLPAGSGSPMYETKVQALLLVTDARFKEMEELYKKQREFLDARERSLAGTPVTPEQALDKAVKPVEVSPVPVEAPAVENKPVQLNLGDEKNPAVKL